MRIQVAFVDRDMTYLNRLVTTLNLKFSDKLEACSFSDVELLYEHLGEVKVVIVNEEFSVDFTKIPENVSFAYLMEVSGVEECRGRRAVCKYQRIDTLYREILDLFSEKAASDYKLQTSGGGKEKIYVFTSPKGGTGASTVACACAVRKAAEGNRVFYLNLEDFGNTVIYFDENGKTLSDVLFAVKSKKANVSIKLESCLQRHSSGVEYFSSCQIPYDLFSMTAADVDTIMKEFVCAKDYDYVIVDINFSMRSVFQQIICGYPTGIILVSDGSESANNKIRRSLGVFQMLEQEKDCDILGRAHLIYNNMSRRVDCSIVEQWIDENREKEVSRLGEISRFGQATNRQIITEIAKESLFDKL